MNYSEKLKDPRWQKKRLEILQRDDWTCLRCGAKDTTLHVHHAAYNADEPWDEAPAMLYTLCADCRDPEHEALRQACKSLLQLFGEIGIHTAGELRWLGDVWPWEARSWPDGAPKDLPESMKECLIEALSNYSAMKREKLGDGTWYADVASYG